MEFSPNLQGKNLGLNASEAVQALSQGMEGIECVDANLLANIIDRCLRVT